MQAVARPVGFARPPGARAAPAGAPDTRVALARPPLREVLRARPTCTRPARSLRCTPVASAAAGQMLASLLPLAQVAHSVGATAAAAPAEAAAFTPETYSVCLGLAAAGAGTTLLLTSRFLLSFWPGLEKRARVRPAARLLRFLTLADPVLDPITRGVFRMEQPGDLNYGAMAALALSSAVITMLVGDGGLAVGALPDLDLLFFFRYLSYVQHMVLLPMWVMVVFRFFLLI